MKVVVFRGDDNAWRYRTVADNGEKLTVSEAYSQKANALRGVEDFLDALILTIPVEIEEVEGE